MEVMPRQPCEAHRLMWDNWQELADRYHGRFVQGVSIHRSTMAVSNPRAYLSIPDPMSDGMLRVDMGYWVVEWYDGGYKVLSEREFDALFVRTVSDV